MKHLGLFILVAALMSVQLFHTASGVTCSPSRRAARVSVPDPPRKVEVQPEELNEPQLMDSVSSDEATVEEGNFSFYYIGMGLLAISALIRSKASMYNKKMA